MADNNELLARVAYLYYKNDFTQQQIADQLGLSRPKIVRLLQEARRNGIVQIEIKQTLPIEEMEGFDLQRLFHLQKAMVVRTEESEAETVESIRRAVASIVMEELPQVRSIGFSYSRTLGNIADYMYTGDDFHDVAVCDLMGAMIGFPVPYGPAADVARRIGGRFYPIFAPIMALEGSSAETYYADPNLRRSMEIGRNVELAVVGIGDSTTQNILYQSGYIAEETVNNMHRQGIVGEMCIHFFNVEGERVESEFEPRVVSVPWESLVNAKNLIMVAAGTSKAQATLAALKTGIVKTLVIDHATARQVLELVNSLAINSI